MMVQSSRWVFFWFLYNTACYIKVLVSNGILELPLASDKDIFFWFWYDTGLYAKVLFFNDILELTLPTAISMLLILIWHWMLRQRVIFN